VEAGNQQAGEVTGLGADGHGFQLADFHMEAQRTAGFSLQVELVREIARDGNRRRHGSAGQNDHDHQGAK